MEKKIWKIKWFLKNFWEDQSGMGVVEVILIIVEICTTYRGVYKVYPDI